MIYKMEMQWKEFSVDLEAVNAAIQAEEYADYAGLQALAEHLEIWFVNEPDQETKDAVQAYWDSIESDSDAALSYRSQAAILEARQSLKEGIPAKEWVDMSALERKMVLNLDVSKAELIAAELL